MPTTRKRTKSRIPLKRKAPKRSSPKTDRAADESRSENVIPLEVEDGSIDKALAKLRGELSHWVNKGRFTKVRFKFRGKALLPDIPVAAVIAAEAATFWWSGLLRALVVNFGAKTVFDVELVSDADAEVARGKEMLLAGDLEQALAQFEKAVSMDRDCAAGYLNIGIAKKLKGDRPGAKDALERAKAINPTGPVGAEAERLLASMEGVPPATA
jgi:tetratricopeptide (TPR) repeat protein